MMKTAIYAITAKLHIQIEAHYEVYGPQAMFIMWLC
jgi:hypothetical protein